MRKVLQVFIMCMICSGICILSSCGHQHSMNSWNFDAESHWAICTDCNETYQKDVHEYDEWQITVEPTILETGSRKQVCKTCGYEHIEVLPNTCEHPSRVAEVVLPTCIEEGYTKRTCSVCSNILKTDYVSALGHVGGVECTRCHTSLVEPTFYPTLAKDLLSPTFHGVFRDLRFVTQTDEVFTSPSIEIEVYLDAENKIVVEGAGMIYQIVDQEPIESPLNLTVKNNILKIIYTSNQEEKTVEYDLGETTIEDSMISQISSIVKMIEAYQTTGIDKIKEVLTDEVLSNSIIQRMINQLMNSSSIDNGYKFEVDLNQVNTIHKELKTSTLENGINALYGENTYGSVISMIELISTRKIEVLLNYMDLFEITLEDVVDGINQLVPLLPIEATDLDQILSSLDILQDESTIDFLMSNRVKQLTIPEFTSQYLALDTNKIFTSIIQTLKDYKEENFYVALVEVLDLGIDKDSITDITNDIDLIPTLKLEFTTNVYGGLTSFTIKSSSQSSVDLTLDFELDITFDSTDKTI